MTVIAALGTAITKANAALSTIKIAANTMLALTRKALHISLAHREDVRTGAVTVETMSLPAIGAMIVAWLETRLNVSIQARPTQLGWT